MQAPAIKNPRNILKQLARERSINGTTPVNLLFTTELSHLALWNFYINCASELPVLNRIYKWFIVSLAGNSAQSCERVSNKSLQGSEARHLTWKRQKKKGKKRIYISESEPLLILRQGVNHTSWRNLQAPKGNHASNILQKEEKSSNRTNVPAAPKKLYPFCSSSVLSLCIYTRQFHPSEVNL